MAGKIRGITIELSADAAGVLDAVKNVNTQLKNTGKELKDVDKLLKMDPGNMDMLRQKTQLLQEQIGNCREKLDALKKAQADMDANGVDKNSKQYRALQREIASTEQELKNLEQTAGSGSATLAKISQVTGQIGEKMEDVGKKLSVVSAAIAAFGAAAVNAFNEVDEGSDIVVKKTGATGQAAKDLEQSYKNVAKSIVADFTDIGSAVGEINTRFKLTGGELEDLTSEFLKFANINDMDVTSAVAGVDKALKTFNVDQSKTQKVLGLLSKTSQDTGISMDTLLGLLQSSGPTLKEMGLNLQDSVTLMGNFEEAGIDSNEMLSKMSKAAVYFNKNGLSMKDGLADLIKRLQDSSTEAEATAEAYEIFGSKAGLAFITAAKEGKLSLSDLETSLDEYGDVVDSTYEQTLDGTDKMRLAWQNMQLALGELGGAIGETLAPIMDKISGFFSRIGEWFRGLDDGTKNAIVTIGLLVAAIGPLLVVGGKIMSGISSISAALSTAGGPIGLIITAVAAATAGIVALVSAWDKAAHDSMPYVETLDALAEAHNNYVQAMDSAKSSYENTILLSEETASAAEHLWGRLQELVNNYDGSEEKAAAILGLVEQLNELVPGLSLSWDPVRNTLSMTNDEFQRNIDLMKEQAKMAALQDLYTESLKQGYEAQQRYGEAQKVVNQLLDDYGLTWDQLDWIMEDGANHAQRLMECNDDLGKSIIQCEPEAQALGAAYDQLNNAADDLSDSQETVAWVEEELGVVTEATANKMASSAAQIAEAYRNTFGTDLPSDLQTAIEAADNAGIEIPQGIIDGLLNGTTSVEDAIAQITALMDQSEAAKSEGEDVGESYTGAVASTVVNEVNTVEAACKGVKDELDISEDAKEIGTDVGSSYNDGLASQTENIAGTSQDIADTITSTMDPLPGEMNTAGSDSGSELDTGWGSWMGTIEGTVEETYNYFLHFFCDTLPPMMSTWGSGAAMNFNTGLNNYVPDIMATVDSIATGMDSQLSVLPGWMEAAGYAAGEGLYNGLAAWAGTLSSMAWDIANSINEAARQALRINSPSKVMAEVGDSVGEGLALGVNRSAQDAIDATANVADSMTGAMDGLRSIDSSINSNFSSSGSVTGSVTNAQMSGIAQLLTQYLPYLAASKDIHFDDGTWAGVLAPAIEKEFGRINTMEARG